MPQKLLQDLIWDRFGIRTREREQFNPIPIAPGTLSIVVPNDPNRVGLFVQNTGPVDLWLSQGPNPLGAQRLLLLANGGFISMWYGEDFGRVGVQWFAFNAGGVNGVIYSLETLIESEA